MTVRCCAHCLTAEGTHLSDASVLEREGPAGGEDFYKGVRKIFK